MKKVLIVEDETAISRVLQAYLQRADFEVEVAYDGEEALHQFQAFQPSLVLLDVMIPNIDGWGVLEQIRNRSSCPVIMLTALGKVDQKLDGLNQGADDYITKPFNADEVVARVHAVLRRSTQLIEDDRFNYFGSLKIDFQAHSVSLHGSKLNFTPRDLSLFLFLAKHPNQTFAREQLIDRVWGMDYIGSDRAVDLAIKRIRKLLQDWPETEGEIVTLRGLGYQLNAQKK